MHKIVIETNTCVFNNKKSSNLNNSFRLIEDFSKTLALADWRFLCRRQDFLDAVSNGDYNKVKEIAKNNLVTK